MSKAPHLSLTCAFLAWKCLLLVVALLSPGQGYDTSTSLLFEIVSSQLSPSSSWVQVLKQRLANRLVRWDAIYYVSIAERGYLYEQEWAFGWGFTRLISTVAESKFDHFPFGQNHWRLIACSVSSMPNVSDLCNNRHMRDERLPLFLGPRTLPVVSDS